MKKKTAVIVISYLCAALMGLGVYAGLQTQRLHQAEREARYRGELAFGELCAAVNGMDAALKKSRYAVSPGLGASLAAEVYSRALGASAALGTLPFATAELEQTAAFLSKTGDFAAYLVRKTAAGEALAAEELEGLQQLSQGAELLWGNLNQLRRDLHAGLVLTQTEQQSVLPTVSDSFLNMEQEFPEIPSLVYDGPFSATVAERTPTMTENARSISEEDARRIAAGFLNTRSNLVSHTGESEGKLPVWRLSDGKVEISVTKAGGYVVRAISSHTPSRTVLTMEDGLDKAEEMLKGFGYRAMKESYHILAGNALTVTYVFNEKGVRCYPDMVKLAIAMDTGELLRLDAEAYLTSHTRRELPEPAVSSEEAQAMVGGGLTLVSEDLAVIPSAGAEEIFCRELLCEDAEGGHVLLYYNAMTGVQEKILILLEDETGTLAL